MRFPITIYGDETVNEPIQIVGSDGQPWDLTTATLAAFIRTYNDDLITTFDLVVDPDQVTNTGILVITLGTAKVDILEANEADEFWWDLKLTLNTIVDYPVRKSPVTLQTAVTRV